MKLKLITMPLVRITLSEKHDIATQHLISSAVHRALIDEFRIPENDFFHIIENIGPSQLRFPQEYLGISHTSDIIMIQIIAATGRDALQKRNLYRAISFNISTLTDVSPKDIIIVLVENTKDNWSFGNGEMQDFNHV